MKINLFQVVVLIIFGLGILIGVFVIATFKGAGGSGSASPVIIWGSMSSSNFNNLLSDSGLSKSKEFKITYLQKDSPTFDNEFVEAIANGDSPDLFFLPQDSILQYKNKIRLIPYNNFPERAFKDTFIQGTEVYLNPEGIVALPIVLDPLVMYWNRDIFTNAGIAIPPKYWDEFYDLADKLTKKDSLVGIERSAFGLGEFSNITNAKEILSTLIMQAGSSIVENKNGVAENALDFRGDAPTLPAVSALSFYTQFADPSKSFYSWSRSLPSSLNFFLSGKLGLYFGFASELPSINKKNPNLNFDLALLPQSRDGKVKVTFGRMQGLAIAKFSKNPGTALNVAIELTNLVNTKLLSEIIGLPPLRRDLLTQKPTDAYASVFYDSAIISRAWLDPDKTKSLEIFRNMIETVTGGRSTIGGAVSTASKSLDNLISPK